MIKTLTKVGNSQALLLDKTMMEALGIDADATLQVSIQGGRLTIEPANVGIGNARAKQHAKTIRKRYGKALKRLAE